MRADRGEGLTGMLVETTKLTGDNPVELVLVTKHLPLSPALCQQCKQENVALAHRPRCEREHLTHERSSLTVFEGLHECIELK